MLIALSPDSRKLDVMADPSIETLTVAANGIRQHVLAAGPVGAPPVLLIHGLGWDATLWRPQLAALAAGGWRAFAPDLRGMGATDKPDQPYGIDGYARDMAAVLDSLAIPQTAVVGFSLGGMIAIALAARAPERVGAAVLACCGASSSAEAQAGTEAMLARAAMLGPRRFAEEQARAIWRRQWAEEHPQAVEDFVAWRAAMDQPALFRAFRASYDVDLHPALPQIAVPALVIAADQDSFVAVETAHDICERLPKGELVVIAESGHMTSIEQPAAFDRALFGFLRRHWPPQPQAAAR
jgi:3-oxoadipate enol-lactonase